jgi:rare lipoprotein A
MTRTGLILSLLLCLAYGTEVRAAPDSNRNVERATFRQVGIASSYGKGLGGHETADGESFDMSAIAAAHRTLAFDTVARVTNIATGQTVKVRINDRGPHRKSRIIDLSAAAASALGFGKAGTASVRVETFASDQP